MRTLLIEFCSIISFPLGKWLDWKLRLGKACTNGFSANSHLVI